MKRSACFLALTLALLALAVLFTTLPAESGGVVGNGATHVSATYVVDRLTDASPGGGGQGLGLAGDLRYVITHAQSGDRITFGVTGMINLSGALPNLSRNVSIEGPGANRLTVHGIGGSVFAVANGATIVLSGLTISGGRGNGGGLFNGGTLTLNNAIVTGNVAGDPTNGGGTGAGIWNYVNATLTLNGCTVNSNSAIGNLSYSSSRGGGIANYGKLTLNNSTVSGNTASQGFGGGIDNIGALTLTNSTVSGNSATTGGGIDNHATLNARNTIFAGNTGNDFSGVLTSQGHNLIGNTTGGSGFAPTDLVNVNPLLGPLQNNGGSTPTMAPSSGSPAIDYVPGTPGVDFPEADQRGMPRPQGALADIGAVEVGGLAAIAGGPYAVFEGGSVMLNGSGSIGATTYTWDLDDDGQFDDAAIPNPTFSAALLDDGIYPVALRVSNGTVTQTDASTVTVFNVAPQVSLSASAHAITAGQAVTFTGAFTDPGVLDTHTLEWDFGDGSPPLSDSLTQSHTFNTLGDFTTILSVTDDDGGSGTASVPILVSCTSLVADAGGPYSVDEGGSISLDGSGSIGATTYAWDLDDDGQFDDAAIPNPTFSAAVLDDGIYPVALRVSNGTDTQTDSSTATVLNVAAQVSLSASTPIITAGQAVTFTGAFTDPGVLDTHYLEWDFGDGSPTVSGLLTRTHVFASQGIFTTTLTVTDDDGGSGWASRPIVVTAPAAISATVFLPLVMR